MSDKNKKEYIKQKAAEPYRQMLGSIFYPSPDNAQNKNISGSEKVAFSLGFEKVAFKVGAGLKPLAPVAKHTPTGPALGGAVYGLKSITGAKAQAPFAAAPKPGVKHRMAIQPMSAVRHGT